MSKLVELLENRQKYDRLNKLSAHSPNTANPKEFSARNQSDLTQGREEIIHSTVIDIHMLHLCNMRASDQCH